MSEKRKHIKIYLKSGNIIEVTCTDWLFEVDKFRSIIKVVGNERNFRVDVNAIEAVVEVEL